MDKWTDQQIKLMKAGGNQPCNEFLERHGVSDSCSIREKYTSPAAELYKQVLLARVEGRPEPTELPKVIEQKSDFSKKMQGFGSGPPPGKPKKHSRLKKVAMAAVPVAAAGAWLLLRR